MSALAPLSAQLDDLKIVTLTDGEVWSARDLMPFAGYERWENWSKAINRAIASVNASGLDAADHFRGVTKMVEVGSGARRQIEDLELTRYACYILFQNADGSKSEIAALQQYFAVQTRKQETAVAPTGVELIALAVIEAQAMLAAKDQRIAELEPVAAETVMYREAEGLETFSDFANRFRAHVQATFPGAHFLRDHAFAHAARLGMIVRGDTVRNNQPTALGVKSGWVVPARHLVTHGSGDQSTKRYARLTPRGGARLWDGLHTYYREHGTFDLVQAVAS
ncbi:hypothetical protein [Microbacterium plantarum]|uniref:hypothetical protein n=1 Tax=Microbacterium plantarum TaxID=1816425 RepID=UPI002B4A229D|nr:hypothetical protein [Microbacterium plantarum]WRK16541.1 hypothetical protein VC184_11545 [Microbacterium plantarum]